MPPGPTNAFLIQCSHFLIPSRLQTQHVALLAIPQAIKQQEWTAALQVEHGKLAAKQRAEQQAAATDPEAK